MPQSGPQLGVAPYQPMHPTGSSLSANFNGGRAAAEEQITPQLGTTATGFIGKENCLKKSNF